MIKICFLAPSGYGKDTASKIIESMFDVSVIKLARPLYELQRDFYNRLGIDIQDKQDGELLQFYGYKIRKESPDYLINTFYKEIGMCNSQIIINDDCRPMDYESLKEMGFIFVKINGYKRNRLDHVEADSKSSLEWQENIPYDYEIDNYGGLEEYRYAILDLLENIKNKDNKLILGGLNLC